MVMQFWLIANIRFLLFPCVSDANQHEYLKNDSLLQCYLLIIMRNIVVIGQKEVVRGRTWTWFWPISVCWLHSNLLSLVSLADEKSLSRRFRPNKDWGPSSRSEQSWRFIKVWAKLTLTLIFTRIFPTSVTVDHITGLTMTIGSSFGIDALGKSSNLGDEAFCSKIGNVLGCSDKDFYNTIVRMDQVASLLIISQSGSQECIERLLKDRKRTRVITVTKRSSKLTIYGLTFSSASTVLGLQSRRAQSFHTCESTRQSE